MLSSSFILHPSSFRPTRRRGSILIMVVALLTLMALIGTALIATARTDRYAAHAYTDSATLDTTRQQFIDQATSMVEDALKNDVTPNVDSPRFDTWLGDRLPERFDPTAAAPYTPYWRHLTGRLMTDPTPLTPAAATAAALEFQPPFQPDPAILRSPASAVAANNYVKMTPAAANALAATGPFYGAVPTSISITYPATHPDESIRNKTRTFPALQFYSNSTTPPSLVPAPNTFLAGDADNDGIADSLLVRLSPTPLNGVTYYTAVRIVDNNSAVNVNTAWSRDHDYDATGTAINPTGFFPTNVGLYELLSQNTDSSNPSNATGRQDRINEIAELNEYRFGYYKDQASTNNYTDSFKDFTGTTNNLLASTIAYEDPDPDTTYGNANLPTQRTDFAFTTQGEALSMQLARRLDNPGYNADPAYTPPVSTYFPTPTTNTPFTFRAYNLNDASTAALAYRFMMVNPETSPSDVELRLRASIYASAPNYTDYPHNTPTVKLPGYGFSSDPNVHHWTSFPANEALLWFQYLDYTSTNPALPANDVANTQFTPSRPAGPSGPAVTAGSPQFRSVRPLLTAYNATSNLVPDSLRWTNTLYAWDRSSVANNAKTLYPGMLSSDMTFHPVADYNSGNTYKTFDMVRDTAAVSPAANGQTYMRTSDTLANIQPSTDTNFTSWEPQPNVTGHAKTNVNLAGFPELWRAYFSAMFQPGTTGADGGTPYDAAYMAEVSAAAGGAPLTTMNTAFYPPQAGATLPFYDIYRGMHWTDTYAAGVDPTFPARPGGLGTETNSLRMFRSPIRDPRPNTTVGLHRLTPYQMMVLRSAIAAVNTKQLLSPTKNTTVVSRKITLYDVDPATSNGAPDPASGIPSTANPIPQYEVTVYGNAPQPFITEVFATNDNYRYTYTDSSTGTVYNAENPDGYVAIELYNPSDVAIPLNGFRLLSVPRDATYNAAGKDVSASPTLLTTLTSGSIPAKSYCVLVGQQASADAYTPPAATFTGSPVTFPVTELTKMIGSGGSTVGELVLLRPRSYGTLDPNVEDGIPIDQFDFTNFPIVDSGNPKKTSWHYARRSDNGAFYVYPGRYDPSVNAPIQPHHQGVHQTPNGASADHTFTPNSDLTAVILDPWTSPANPSALPQPFKGLIETGVQAWGPVTENPPINLGGANTQSTYYNSAADPNLLSIQLTGPDMPGRHIVAAAGNLFPFGGFARDGDILQVPYIGAYRIRLLDATSGQPAGTIDPGTLVGSAPTVLEFNSVTMDAAFAEDTEPTNNVGTLAQENVGRFTPTLLPVATIYDWTRNLFTYVTTQGAPLDYLPDTSPYTYTPGITNPQNQPQPVASHSGGTVLNANDYTTTQNEDLIPSQGKININTAPARVLSLLPMVPTAAGAVDPIATEALANAIATFRETGANGNDFRSILDLNKVTNFQQGGATSVLTTDPSDLQGDYSGLAINGTGTANADGVRFDFEEQYLMANRISNLITTKSDTYTVYILVQGWRNAGTPFPVLDWEKRVAYIMDRSTGTVRKTLIPAE